MAVEAQTIIKKIKKGGHEHPHSSAWKVAYADFVTAMMAFFLMLWLLNVTTDEQKEGIAEYFMPTIAGDGPAGSVGFSGGSVTEMEGPLNLPPSGMPSVMVGLPPREAGGQGSGHGGGDERDDRTERGAVEAGRATLDHGVPEQLPDPAEEERRFDDLERQLREVIAADPELQGLEANLVIDRTEEGLRIQIVDQEERSMFPRGSAEMYPFMAKLLGQVARVMDGTTNKVAIGGYTDSTAFRSNSANDNWSLSAMRANAARRALAAAGLDEERLARVMGKAHTDPFDPTDPTAAVNRRISIVLLYTHGPRPELGTPQVQASRSLPKPTAQLGAWQP